MAYTVKIGLSNKHVHLSQEHLDVLFGHVFSLGKWVLRPRGRASGARLDGHDLGFLKQERHRIIGIHIIYKEVIYFVF